MADTVVEIFCHIGTTRAYLISLGGVGTPAAEYVVTQVSGNVHTITVPESLQGRWHINCQNVNGIYGSRVVFMVDVDGTIQLGQEGHELPGGGHDVPRTFGIIKRMKRQTGVLWQINGHDKWGKPTYDFPIQFQCRWDDTRTQFLTTEGENATSAAVVYPECVIKEGSRLWEGCISTLTSTDSTIQKDVFECRQFSKIPTLRNSQTLFIAYLQ